MPTPSGQISLDDIWQEPNAGWSTSESFGNVAFDSWAQGPLGSNANSWNGWGNDGSTMVIPVGADVIYNVGGPLQRGVDAINFGNYSNKYYYFDGTIYNIVYTYNNTLVSTIPFIDNDVSVQIDCYDYSGVYTVHPSFAINAVNNTQTFVPIQIPGFITNTHPLIENIYWSINVVTNPTNTITNIAFSVNGTTVYNAGAAGGSFTWQSGGASQGYTNGSGIVYDVYIT